VDISTRSHVGPDGTLRLEVATGLRNTDVAVHLLVEPVSVSPDAARDWPPGFFEETYGSLREDPLLRPDQGEFDVRERV
jgi:hypothetical protein